MERFVFLVVLALCAGFDARDQTVPGWALAAAVATAAYVGAATTAGVAAQGPWNSIVGSFLVWPAVVAQRFGTVGAADGAIILAVGTAYGYEQGALVLLAACTSAILTGLPGLLPLRRNHVPVLAKRAARRVAFLPHILIGTLLAGGSV